MQIIDLQYNFASPIQTSPKGKFSPSSLKMTCHSHTFHFHLNSHMTTVAIIKHTSFIMSLLEDKNISPLPQFCLLQHNIAFMWIFVPLFSCVMAPTVQKSFWYDQTNSQQLLSSKYSKFTLTVSRKINISTMLNPLRNYHLPYRNPSFIISVSLCHSL